MRYSVHPDIYECLGTRHGNVGRLINWFENVGNEKIVKLLMQSGASVNTRDNNGDEPFQVVLNSGNHMKFHWYYPFRAQANFFFGQFDLGYENIANLLIETRREGGKNLLHFAVENGKTPFCWIPLLTNSLAEKL